MDRRTADALVKKLSSDLDTAHIRFIATTVLHGALKGKVVIHGESRIGCLLLELPLELRERIYGFALPNSETFHIKKRRYPGTLEDKDSDSAHEKLLKSLQRSRVRALSLLMVNKQIHAEATPLVYRSNCFEFKKNIGSKIHPFIKLIGPSVQHLGEVKLHHISIPQLKEVLVLLKPATGLRKLHLPIGQTYLNLAGSPHSRLYQYDLLLDQVKRKAKVKDDPVSWACAFNKVVSNFLMDLNKAYKASDRSWKAADVVHFVRFIPHRRPVHWSEESHRRTRLKLEADLDKFEETFREIARGYLED